MRHTWATWHRQAGTPTHELQRLGGWRSSVMVERYAHLAPDLSRRQPTGSMRYSVVTI
ncbi:MAG: tyrosine-type recombinase/integrase [Casimicrobiaceae bacterium]